MRAPPRHSTCHSAHLFCFPACPRARLVGSLSRACEGQEAGGMAGGGRGGGGINRHKTDTTNRFH
jgi:hypothetical protein